MIVLRVLESLESRRNKSAARSALTFKYKVAFSFRLIRIVNQFVGWEHRTLCFSVTIVNHIRKVAVLTTRNGKSAGLYAGDLQGPTEVKLIKEGSGDERGVIYCIFQTL